MEQALSLSHRLSDSLALAKPRISLLALITAAAGMWIAPQRPSWGHLLAALLGILLLVAGANALNMFLERDVDGLMERTRHRPLPGQRMSPDFGLGIGALFIGLAIPVLFYGVNPLTGVLGLVSLGIYVLCYTPLKRKTSLALWIGAIPGAAPPLLGWSAAMGTLALPAWLLFAIVFFWQVPHFLAIGTFRREEYHRAGLKLFPMDQSALSMKAQVVFCTVVLFPIAFMLYSLGYAGKGYAILSVLLNALFLGTVFWGIRKDPPPRWGKRVFLVSLIHLTSLFSALFVDGGAP